MAQVVPAVVRAEPGYVAMGLLFALLAVVIEAVRFRLLLIRHGIAVTAPQVLATNLASRFYGLLLPGSLSTGAFRWYRFGQGQRAWGTVLASIVFARLLDTIVLVIFGLTFWLIARPSGSSPLVGVALVCVLVLLLATHALLRLGSPGARRLMAPIERLWRLVGMPAAVWERGARLAQATAEGYRSSQGMFGSLAALSGLVHGCAMVSGWCFALSLRMHIPFSVIGWVNSTVTVLLMLPISIAGLGVREGSLLALLGQYGVSQPDAVAFSVLWLGSAISMAVAGGCLELYRALRRRAIAPVDTAPEARTARPGSDSGLMVIVVLNLNKSTETIRCLGSVFSLEYSPFEVVCIDNGSTDGSDESIKLAFPRAHHLRSEVNLGVAGGRNLGLSYAETHFSYAGLFFLDNDAWVEPGCLGEMVDILEADPAAGLVEAKALRPTTPPVLCSAGGHRINWYTGTIRTVGAGEIDRGQHDAGRPQTCSGGLVLIRRSVFEAIGGFDNGFNPYGWEDLDLGLRAGKAGFTIRFAPRAIAYHEGGKAGRGRAIPEYERSKTRGYFRLFKRHASPLQWTCFLALLPLRAIGRTARDLVGGHTDIVWARLRGPFGAETPSVDRSASPES